MVNDEYQPNALSISRGLLIDNRTINWRNISVIVRFLAKERNW